MHAKARGLRRLFAAAKPGESNLNTGAISREFWKMATPKALTNKLRDTGAMPFGWRISKLGYKCAARGTTVKGGIATCAKKAAEQSKDSFQLCDDPKKGPSCVIFDTMPKDGLCTKNNVCATPAPFGFPLAVA